MQHFSQLLLQINENILLFVLLSIKSERKTAQKFALENICAVFLANQFFSSFAFALCINDFSLFYLDHSIANAAKSRSRSV